MIKTWQAVLASIGIFMAGAIAGGAIAVGLEQGIAQRQKTADDQAQANALTAAQAQATAQQAELQARQAEDDTQLAVLRARIQTLQNARRGQPGQQPQFGPQLMRRLMAKLAFTPEQKAQIAPVVRSTGEELARLRRETQMRTAVVIERTMDQIEDVLTPQQKTQFEDLLKDRRKLLQQLINQPRHGAQGGKRLDHPAPAEASGPALPGTASAAGTSPAGAANAAQSPAKGGMPEYKDMDKDAAPAPAASGPVSSASAPSGSSSAPAGSGSN